MAHTLDGGCPFYAVYACRDAQFVALGALEPQFYAAFRARFAAALPPAWLRAWGTIPTTESQYERATWPELRRLFEKGFKLLSRDEWVKVFHGAFHRADVAVVLIVL